MAPLKKNHGNEEATNRGLVVNEAGGPNSQSQ